MIKYQLEPEAASQLSYLQDAVDSQIASEQETQLLVEWKKYRVLVNRIDTELAQILNGQANQSKLTKKQKL